MPAITTNQIINTYSTKFLGLFIDSALSWNNHIDQLMTKLSTARYKVRSVKPCWTQETERKIYFSNIHSILTYGIIFWSNSSYCNNIFKTQKKNN
jgi:hypothetical protein